MHKANRIKKNDNGKGEKNKGTNTDATDGTDTADVTGVTGAKISKINIKPKKKTETLSSLLKHFDKSLPYAYKVIQEIPTLITRTNLKESWVDGYIKSNSKTSKSNKSHKTSKSNKSNTTKTSAETIAINTANFLENVYTELEESIKKIEAQKDQALSFARSSFLYLNNVHKDTCLGEAGKIMLDLFDKGELTGDIIYGLLEHAEHLSKSKDLPFSNKLTTAQTKAINFMVEERDLRISPTIEELQNYSQLYSSAIRWKPLLEALLEDNLKVAQQIVDQIPD